MTRRDLGLRQHHRPRARSGHSSTALLAAFPVLVLALVIFVFYAVEAWSRKTPWIFTDELEWTQISRSIAATGHAARRGDPPSTSSRSTPT